MGVETTVSSSPGWSPDVTAIAPSAAVPRALILTTSTVAGSVEGDAVAVRAVYVDDAAAAIVAEGSPIPEADPDLAEAVVYTSKVSQLVRVSREQWRQPNAAGLLSESVARAVTRAGDLAYIAQVAPTSPAVSPPAGLVNVAGITTGTVADDLDGLVDAFAAIAAADGNVTHLVASPTAWASLRKFKSGTGSALSLLGAGTEDAVPMLLGVPLLISSAVPAGQMLALDSTAVISAAGPVEVATSQDAYFGSDSIGVRATWRIGATVVKPERIALLDVTAPV